MLAYVACRGNEGVVGPGDLKVRALSVPGEEVTVDPGACSILCRSPGQLHQAYAGRVATQDRVGIAPTTSSGGRSDLVVARVEDPWLAGEPWNDPIDPAKGPYIFSRVIPNVPPTTTKFSQLGRGESAIALARIDIPPSTGTITNAMIVDLRTIANPRRERRVLVSSPGGNDDLTTLNSWRDWPAVSVQSVAVPPWATQAKIVSHVSGALVTVDRVDGYLRNRLDGQVGQSTRFDTNLVVSSSNPADRMLMTADEMPIPAAYRGTNRNVALQAQLSNRGSTTQGVLRAYGATTVVIDVEFLEVPEP